VVAQREIPGWATRADAIITLDNEVLQTGQEEVRLRLPILQSGHDPRVSHEQCGWDAGPLPSQHIRLELVSDDEAVSRLYAEELQRNIHDQWIRFPDELVEPVLGCDFDCRGRRGLPEPTDPSSWPRGELQRGLPRTQFAACDT
jgi:hypothetical protein